ncbi:MAG: glycoside hydrolase family 88 protein [Bacteroidales bacterium]|nr:glycoside hydrolase family 88 protein [Bacteroidales bacterium]
MNKRALRFTALGALLLTAIGTAAQDYDFRLRNSLGWQRTEVVELTLPEGVTATGKALTDSRGQAVAFTTGTDGRTLRFVAQVDAGTTAAYTLAEGTRLEPQQRTYAALKMPSSRNDIAWENDLTAYRMYSHTLLASEPNTANGVDLWQKKRPTPVIDAMYGLSNNYHFESEYGVDAYSVNGKTLGCGGVAAVVGGHLLLHNPFDQCEIVETSALRSVFVLTFNNVVIDGQTYTKTLRIETTAGRLLNKATVRLTGAKKTLRLAVGIYTHDNMGLNMNGVNFTSVDGLIGRAENKSEGTVTSPNPRFYEGAYMPQDAETQVIDNHLCLVADYEVGTDLTYYFGGGWNVFPKSLYTTDTDWFDALSRFKSETEHPLAPTSTNVLPRKDEVADAIRLANAYWQTTHPNHGNYFWNHAVYHIGNMEAYFALGNETYRQFSTAWAEHNNWKGATANNWNYNYGENNVLFGDCQVCFQVYADLYRLEPEQRKIARALEVMEHEIATSAVDYWWWVDGLFMVMPVMTKLYNITGNEAYLEKMHTYWTYSNSIMYDSETGLYFRDANYVYPAHKTNSGKKDFWARGDGWIFAAFARILSELPPDHQYRDEYITYYRRMAATLKQHQQSEGYWTRSILDPAYAPGRETSGTALMTYAYTWGVNNGLLSEVDYGEVIERAWNYLSKTALQSDGLVGYVQPIGANAAPGTTVSATQTGDFGVGAFLMACSELYRYAGDNPTPRMLRLGSTSMPNPYTVTMTFNVPVDAAEAANLSHFFLDGKPVEGTVSVEGRDVTIELAQMLDYGRYTLRVEGLHSSEGGAMESAAEQMLLLTVPLYPNALIKTVSASGNQTGNTPQNTIDNSLSTRWSQAGKGQWIQAELSATTEIRAIDAAFYQGAARVSYFDIQTSTDGTHFSTVLPSQQTSGLTNEMERYHIRPTEARYVRLVCNGNSQGGDQWNSITELRVVAVDTSRPDDVFASISIPAEVWTDLILPEKTVQGDLIHWVSDHPALLNGSGVVHHPDGPTAVTLSAQTRTVTKDYVLTLQPRSLPDNLLLCYTFEPEDLYTDGSSRMVRDLSPHVRDARLMGSARANGMLDLTANTAADFSTNGYVLVPEHVMDSLRSYTFLLRCNLQSTASQPRLYDFGSGSGNSVFLRTDGLAAGLKLNGATTRLQTSSTPLTTGREQRIAVTYNASTRETTLYIDGQVVAQGTTIANEPYELVRVATDSRNYIGRTQWWDTNVASVNIDLRGTLDDFCLYSLCLTKEEIDEVQTFGHDLPTGIATAEHQATGTGGSEVFDLQGRRVAISARPEGIKSLSPGIYIVGGKKVLVR